ncbi:MAG: PrsW family intramembrane metalloprotease [Anaerolineae bacterium]|nr:PrsW family intramembrane metalloprotease [Anaerolineae bacterium]
MTPIQTVLGILISIGIPLGFLGIVYILDMYGSRTTRLVLISFGWGGIGGLGLAFAFNTYVAIPLIARLNLSYLLLFVAFAPVAEELLKSLSLLYISRQPEFTYFVDGAIYGFAAGIGFAISENLLYMTLYPDQGIATYLVRGFSTCLMHGTAAALVGGAVGLFRFRKRSSRWLAMVGGWAAAIFLHVVFNSVSNSGALSQTVILVVLVFIGLAGVGLIATFISLGLREQRKWMEETLDRQMGVSGAEVRAAQSFSSIDELLEPIIQQFPKKGELIEKLLLSQAKMGIKRKVQLQVQDPKLEKQLGEEIARLQDEMERLRKEIGPYVMVFVRTVFPEGVLDLWAQVIERMAMHDDGVFDEQDRATWKRHLKAEEEKPFERRGGLYDLGARIKE